MDAIIWPPAGRYILAVSGGIDSMTLLDIFAAAAPPGEYELTVAHYDHGIRSDSRLDQDLVVAAAARYGLSVETEAGQLGAVSEVTARDKRYEFLERVQTAHHAAAIITAHHADDLVETSLLNLARGTGRRGLAPFETSLTLRPLKNLARAQIEAYAAEHQLTWSEDSTNADMTNPRNFLRRELLPAAPSGWSERYLGVIKQTAALNHQIDLSLSQLGQWETNQFSIDRRDLGNLSLDEVNELIIMAVRRLDADAELDRRLVAELALFAQTGSTGKHRPIRGSISIEIQPQAVVIYIPQNGLR